MIINRVFYKIIMFLSLACFMLQGCGWEDDPVTETISNLKGIKTIEYVSASSTKITLKGSGSTQLPESTKLTFKVLDGDGATVQNAKISFVLSDTGVTNGVTLSTSEVLSDASGMVVVTAYSGLTVGSFSVNAQYTNKTTTITSTSDSISIIKKSELVSSISFVSLTNPTIALKGNGNEQVPDNTTIKFKLVDSGGASVSGATVNLYTSTDTGGITLSNTTATSDANGEITVTAYAGSSLTTFEVWASLETNNSIKAKSSTVTITSNKVKAISFISASPTLIALKGTGGTDLTESSAVKFKAVDESGNPVSGASLNFALSTSNGGIALGTTSGKTNTSGEITVNVTSGTIPTSVTVIASLSSDINIRVISSQINVSTGRAEKGSFSVGPEGFHAIGAWTTNGIEKKVNARAFDRFHHPVPDGTVISFRTEWGGIDSFCQTSAGSCSVTWRSVGDRTLFNSQNPMGRVTVTASVMGEEKFVDINSDGMFDSNDQPFWNPAEGELPELFINSVEIKKVLANSGASSLPDTNVYKWSWIPDTDYVLSTDEFLDDNLNGIWDTGNGKYNGKLCTDAAEASGTCSKELVRVWDSSVILATPPDPAASASMALYDAATGNPVSFIDLSSLAIGSSRSYVLEVKDYLGNPLPGATSITFAGINAAGEAVELSTSVTKITIPESASIGFGTTLFNFAVFRTAVQKVQISIKVSGAGEREYNISVTEPIT